MKLIYSFFSLFFLLFCSSCSDDIEVAKQESPAVFLTEETSAYRTKENAIIEVEHFIKKDKSATRTGSSLNYSIGNEIYFYRDTITNQDYPSFYIANADGVTAMLLYPPIHIQRPVSLIPSPATFL